jgi:hypothetical protein
LEVYETVYGMIIGILETAEEVWNFVADLPNRIWDMMSDLIDYLLE